MKLIYLTLLLAAIAILPAGVSAQNLEGHAMESDLSEISDASKFVIEVKFDLDSKFTSFQLFCRDLGGSIEKDDFISVVKPVDKKCRIVIPCEVMKQGRLRGVHKDGKLSDSWINLYVIPGLTIYLTVHDDSYEIANESQYDFMVNAWQNEIPVAALMARLGKASGSLSSSATSDFQLAINNCKQMISDLQQQIKFNSTYITPGNERNRAVQINLELIEGFNKKMANLIDQYMKSLSF